jgi:hypothetical protein
MRIQGKICIQVRLSSISPLVAAAEKILISSQGWSKQRCVRIPAVGIGIEWQAKKESHVGGDLELLEQLSCVG